MQLIALLSLLALTIYSCDVIDAPYEETGGSNGEPIDGEIVQKILIEEFTGYYCGNCPEAQRIAKNLQKVYPGRLYMVAVHAGGFAIPRPAHPVEFRNPTADALNSFFNVRANPLGLVNRVVPNDGNRLIAPDAWEATIVRELTKAPNLGIKVDASYNANTNAIEAKITMDYVKPGSSNDNVVVYMVEDSIIAYQKDSADPTGKADANGMIKDFIHTGVLRGAMNGTFGESVAEEGLAPEQGKTYIKNYSFTIPTNSTWVPKNMKIVAYVHDNAGTFVIKQVEEAKVAVQ